MTKLSLPLTQLIHNNLSIVMTFAFSRKDLEKLRQKFKGEWKNLDKALFSIQESRASKAAIEFAVFTRLLDDQEDLSGSLKELGTGSFGRLNKERRA